MILGIGMSVAVVVVLGMVGTYGLKWKRSYEKRNEIPYQKVNLKETNPAQKYYYESLSEKDKVVWKRGNLSAQCRCKKEQSVVSICAQ